MLVIATVLSSAHAALFGDDQCTTCQCRCEEQCRRENGGYDSDDSYVGDDDHDKQVDDDMNERQDTDPNYDPGQFSVPMPAPNAREPQSCNLCARQNLEIVNEYRRRNGLHALEWNEGLEERAAGHSKQMYTHLSLYHSNYRVWENVAYS